MTDSPLTWLRKVGGGTPPAEPTPQAPVQPPEPVQAAPPAQEAPPPVAPVAPPPAAPHLSLVTPDPVPSPAGARLAAPAGEGYRAYGADHADGTFLEIRRVPEVPLTHASDAFPYSYLLRTGFTGGPAGDRVLLFFSEACVILNGVHLSELFREVQAGKVQFVEEYDAGRFPRPAAGAPVITGIQLIEPGDPAARSSGKGRKAAAS